MRPPPLVVDDDHFRHDIDSDDVRRVYPDLPTGDARERLLFLERCDMRAFEAQRPGWIRTAAAPAGCDSPLRAPASCGSG
jgi:hypothetical protein